MDQIVADLANLRRTISDSTKAEAKLKKNILSYMDDTKTDCLTTPNFVCSRNYRERDVLTKKQLPEDLWDAYKDRVEYVTLSISERRRSRRSPIRSPRRIGN